MEKFLCKIFFRVEIRGKRGRIVFILLILVFEKSINLFIEIRKLVGVNF